LKKTDDELVSSNYHPLESEEISIGQYTRRRRRRVC